MKSSVKGLQFSNCFSLAASSLSFSNVFHVRYICFTCLKLLRMEVITSHNCIITYVHFIIYCNLNISKHNCKCYDRNSPFNLLPTCVLSISFQAVLREAVLQKFNVLVDVIPSSDYFFVKNKRDSHSFHWQRFILQVNILPFSTYKTTYTREQNQKK